METVQQEAVLSLKRYNQSKDQEVNEASQKLIDELRQAVLKMEHTVAAKQEALRVETKSTTDESEKQRNLLVMKQALEQKMQYLEATYDYTNEIEGIPTELFDQIVKSNI